MKSDPAATTYVTIDPNHSQRLLEDLSDIARAHNLTPWSESVSPNDGGPLYLFDGNGRALNIWAQNMTLSGRECPEFPSAGSDPGQFQVVVGPAVWFPIWKRAHVLFRAVKSDLEAKGYVLTSTPSAPCQPDRPKIKPSQ